MGLAGVYSTSPVVSALSPAAYGESERYSLHSISGDCHTARLSLDLAVMLN